MGRDLDKLLRKKIRNWRDSGTWAQGSLEGAGGKQQETAGFNNV